MTDRRILFFLTNLSARQVPPAPPLCATSYIMVIMGHGRGAGRRRPTPTLTSSQVLPVGKPTNCNDDNATDTVHSTTVVIQNRIDGGGNHINNFHIGIIVPSATVGTCLWLCILHDDDNDDDDDISGSSSSVVVSIANYIVRHHWQYTEFTAKFVASA